MHQQWELTTATEAEELLELDAAKDTFSLALLGDSDSDSTLKNEDVYIWHVKVKTSIKTVQ